MSGTITALKQQVRNPDRLNIYLDGEYAFSLSKIAAAWLIVGQSLSDDKISSLQIQDAQEVAYQHAIKYIQYRPHSSQEVRQYLTRHHVTPDIIELVLERLGRSGLIDDQEFAKLWVENRSRVSSEKQTSARDGTTPERHRSPIDRSGTDRYG